MNRLTSLLVVSACLAGHLAAQSLVMVSGGGQLVYSPSVKTTDPLVVEAMDANGKPLPGVAVTWAISKGQGNVPHPTLVTDASGQASTDYTSPALNSGDSFSETTVTASSKYGSVDFIVINVALIYGSAPPTVTLLVPTPASTVSALPGSTLPGAVKVKLQAGAGAESNAPIPNASVHMVNGIDPTQPPAAQCGGPDGYVYTDSTGVATCDLMVTAKPGEYALRADVGQFQSTAAFTLQVNSGPACTYSISPTSHPVSATGGTGSVKVASASGCGWSATSNEAWITITGGASGSGNGTVSYSVGADGGAARVGTVSIAGTTFTINQSSGSAGALTITTPANLPGGAVNQSYSTTLAASGGVPPYAWSISAGALPAGLKLNASTGLISGAATAAGTSTFTATVQDNAGTSVSLVLSLTINTASSTFEITNTSFPNGVVNQPYTQALTSSGGVVTPFAPQPVFQVVGGALPDGVSIIRNTDLSFAISGTPTTAGVFNFTLSATDAAGNAAAANFTITITGTPTTENMAVAPAMLAFSVQLGSTTAPAPQSLAITGNTGVLAYTSVITTASGGGWLTAQNSSGNTPGSMSVSVTNYANLQAGTYTGTITISSVAANSPIAVPVTLTVLSAPSLAVTPPQINLSQGQSTAPNVSTQSVLVSAAGGQTEDTSGSTPVSFSVAVTTNQGGGNWLTVSPTTGMTPATLTVSIDSGGLSIGTYTGTITITPTSGAVQLVTVTLNVINPQMLSATPAPVAFTYVQGAPAPDAKTVTVSSSTGPALSLSTAVATTDKGNWLFVNPSSGTSPLDLSVSVNPAGLTPNTYSGTITVTASDDSVAPLPIPVTLTVVPPVPAIMSVVNAASSAAGPIAPGEFVTIYGSGLGPDTPVSAASGAPTISPNLGGTQVFFGSHSAPILFTSAGQVNVIVPYGVANADSANLTVWYQGTASAGDDLRVIDAVPGIFMLSQSGQGAIINQDGTINSETNGAPVGSVISIFGTGQGQTNPAGMDGAIAMDASVQPPPLPVTVSIGGVPATVTYAGAAPGEPDGFMQVNAMIPQGVPTGASVPVQITVGTASSQAGVTMYIHP